MRDAIKPPRVPGPRSSPIRRLLFGLMAEGLRWGAIVALVRGSIWMGLLGMLGARLIERVDDEASRW